MPGPHSSPRSHCIAHSYESFTHLEQRIVRFSAVAPPHALQHGGAARLCRHVQLLADVGVVGNSLRVGRQEAAAGREQLALRCMHAAATAIAAATPGQQGSSSRAAAPGRVPFRRPVKEPLRLTCSTSALKSFGCGDVKRTRSSGCTPATALRRPAKPRAPSRRGTYTLLKPGAYTPPPLLLP